MSHVDHAPVILDISGQELNDDDRRRIQHPLTGGLILFRRNWRDRQQLTDLCAEINTLRPDLPISVDHEGGRVFRFRGDGGLTHLPPMRALGQMWDDGLDGPMRAQNAATACGYVLASELRSCGVDLAWTPVIDLDHGRSEVIGDRSFHRDPMVVSMLAKSVIVGLLRAGMQNCGKHFPGHGYAEADSHHAIAVDERSLDEILADDARPYEWLSTTLSCVMPAHVIYPQVDSMPAGFSARWLKDILRERMGYQGALVCDDLSMTGSKVAGNAVEGAIAALNAGCDLVLLCNQSLVDGGKPVDELLDGLSAALEQGRWQADAQSEARRVDLIPQSSALLWDELMNQPLYQQALSLVLPLCQSAG